MPSAARDFVVTHPSVVHQVAAALTTTWMTAPEIAKRAHVRRDRAQEALADLARAREAEHAIGPPGRSPKARCWRRPPRTPQLLEPTRDESPTVTTPPAPRPLEGKQPRGVTLLKQGEEPPVKSRDQNRSKLADWKPREWFEW